MRDEELRRVPNRCSCGSRKLTPVPGRAEWECVACGKHLPEIEAGSPPPAVCERCGQPESHPKHYYFDPDEGEFNGFHAFVPCPATPTETSDAE